MKKKRNQSFGRERKDVGDEGDREKSWHRSLEFWENSVNLWLATSDLLIPAPSPFTKPTTRQHLLYKISASYFCNLHCTQNLVYEYVNACRPNEHKRGQEYTLLLRFFSCMQALARMHTHTHTHTQPHAHACTHTHTKSNTHTHTHTRNHTHTHAHTHTHKI